MEPKCVEIKVSNSNELLNCLQLLTLYTKINNFHVHLSV